MLTVFQKCLNSPRLTCVPLKLAEAAARVDGSVTRLEDALAQWAQARLNGHIDEGQPFERLPPL